jgi:hypothetical protein
MAARPEIIPFNDYVNAHREEFTPFELWMVDELTDHLVNKLDLDREYTSVVIDTDEDQPISSITEGKVHIRLNGRFYVPKEDRNGKELTETNSQWADIAKEWFEEVEIEVTFDEGAEDLLKFTAMVPTIEIEGVSGGEEEVAPEGEETAPEGEETEEGDETPPEEETPPEGEETTPSEEGEETPPEETEEETEEAPPTEESSEELQEFEKALGL